MAGPIQGAPDWQSDMVRLLARDYSGERTLIVFNPRHTYSENQPFNYSVQVRWERNHLLRAAKLGALAFWFAAKDDSLPYESGRTYAQTTRIELGEAFGWRAYNPGVNIALGIEPGYRGNESYFREMAGEFNLPIHESLATLAGEVLRLITKG